MRASIETYKNVAEHCSEFDPKDKCDSYTNVDGKCDTTCSCLNCNHFIDSSYCNINLYDEIVNSHDF